MAATPKKPTMKQSAASKNYYGPEKPVTTASVKSAKKALANKPAPAKPTPKPTASKPKSSGFVGIKEADQARITERYMKAQEAKKTAAKQAAARKAAGMRAK
jgi:hypothetical protein